MPNRQSTPITKLAALFLLVLLSGCAATTEYWETTPPASAPGIQPIAQHANVFIRSEDLKDTTTWNSSIEGALFPEDFRTGKTYEQYLKTYFGAAFSEYALNKKPWNAPSVYLKLDRVHYTTFTGTATVELDASVIAVSGKKLMQKTYSASGVGHGPFYANDNSEAQHAGLSLKDAFSKVFSQLLLDKDFIKAMQNTGSQQTNNPPDKANKMANHH